MVKIGYRKELGKGGPQVVRLVHWDFSEVPCNINNLSN